MPCELPRLAARDHLADYTRPELIVPQLRGTDLAEIIEELSHRLRMQGAIGDVLSFYHAALNCEFLSSSAMPCGVAVPHARSVQVQRLTFAMGRTTKPVVWGTRGSWRVDCVFLIAVPSTEALEYLTLLSSIAHSGRQSNWLAGLRSAPDAERIFGLLQSAEARPR